MYDVWCMKRNKKCITSSGTGIIIEHFIVTQCHFVIFFFEDLWKNIKRICCVWCSTTQTPRFVWVACCKHMCQPGNAKFHRTRFLSYVWSEFHLQMTDTPYQCLRKVLSTRYDRLRVGIDTIIAWLSNYLIQPLAPYIKSQTRRAKNKKKRDGTDILLLYPE